MESNMSLMSENEKGALYLIDQAMGYTYQAALRAAAVLGVADHLIKGPKTIQDLAKDLGVDWKQLNRVMRLLATRHIFLELDDGRFSLNPPAEYLCTSNRYSLRSAVLMLTDETFWRPLGNLAEAFVVILPSSSCSICLSSNIGHSVRRMIRVTTSIPACLPCLKWRICSWSEVMTSRKTRRWWMWPGGWADCCYRFCALTPRFTAYYSISRMY